MFHCVQPVYSIVLFKENRKQVMTSPDPITKWTDFREKPTLPRIRTVNPDQSKYRAKLVTVFRCRLLFAIYVLYGPGIVWVNRDDLTSLRIGTGWSGSSLFAYEKTLFSLQAAIKSLSSSLCFCTKLQVKIPLKHAFIE